MVRRLLPLCLAVGCRVPIVPLGDGGRGLPWYDADTGAAPLERPAGPCGLVVDEPARPGLEGEVVTLSVACAQTPEAIAAVQALGLPEGADWSPETGTLTWPTDGADAGTWSVTLSAPGPEVGDFPETAVVDLVVVDDPTAPGATPPDPDRYVEEWGLPVIHIDPEGELRPHKVDARLTVAGEGFDGTVKLRGATSLAYPKNSFTLDFEGEEAELPGWGGRSRGHMVLISNFDDNSHVRQKLVYDTWAAMADVTGGDRLTPRTAYAVVYLSGQYHGLYLACDRIDDEFTRHMGWSGRGELYKAVDHDANYDLVDSEGALKDDLALGWEKKEGDPLDDFSSLVDLVAFVGDATPESFAAAGDRWVDLDEFLDWWILVTWTQSEDSASKNHYLYRDDADAVFRYVPWDFNASYGQSWKTKRNRPTLVRDHTVDNRAFWLMWADPGLRARAAERYADWTAPGAPLSADWQRDRLDHLYEGLDEAISRDEARWGEAYRTFERWQGLRDSRDDWTDAAGERAYVEAWIAARPDGMGDWPVVLPGAR